MARRHIIAVEPASGSGEVVVVEVYQEGPQPLDLRLVGCEGENPYVASIRHRNLGRLKHKFKGTDDEWTAIFSRFLLQQQPNPDHVKSQDSVRLVYALQKDRLVLSIRQDVQSIKVTLGEIALPRDDDYEFNPFEWAQASAQAHAKTLQDLSNLRARVSIEQDTVAKLSAQLDDFIKTKNEAETAMLQKFMELLNEKKRKIRDQSRLLACATVDETAAAAMQASSLNTRSRKAGASRISKRKVSAQREEPAADSQSDNDIAVDQSASDSVAADDAHPLATPDHSEDDTDEEEDAAQPAQESSSQTIRSATASQSTKDQSESDGRPPPKRELPFGKPGMRSRASEPAPEPAGADDMTDDEEL